jgi:hypothetical protein
MAIARSESKHKTIIGPIDKTLDDFLKTAPAGSELIIGTDSAEMITIVEFSDVNKFLKRAKLEAKIAKRKINHTLKEGVTLFSAVGTLRQAR